MMRTHLRDELDLLQIGALDKEELEEVHVRGREASFIVRREPAMACFQGGFDRTSLDD